MEQLYFWCGFSFGGMLVSMSCSLVQTFEHKRTLELARLALENAADHEDWLRDFIVQATIEEEVEEDDPADYWKNGVDPDAEH